MIKKRSDIKGETLIETIIALSVMAIGITIASTVVLNSFRNMAVAKQRIIAINIAREGIEAMRNIRDTNWLLYSDKRRQCWNHDPGAGVCDGLNPIQPGIYVIYQADDRTWQLEFADTDRDSDTDDPPDGIEDNDPDSNLVKLSLVDIDLSIDSDNADGNDDDDTGNDDDTDMYNHMDDRLDSPPPFGTLVKSTPFSRYIVIEYLENQPDPDTAPSKIDPPEESINTKTEWEDGSNVPVTRLNRMRITSVVEWIQKGDLHSVDLETIITDHLGREDLTS